MMRKPFLAAFVAALCILLPMSARAQGWLELPASAHPKLPEPRIVTTQYMVQGGDAVRSHTYRYDPSLRVSLWVAYPLNAGLIGQGSRGDGWHPYAGLEEGLQPALYKGFKYGSGYDRGHQIPSADRLDREINYETFVFINATPQRHEFNEGVWADLEKLVRTWAKRSDTLYVVTGVIPGKTTIRDNDGDPVNIPDAYYKAALRRNTDKTGRLHWSMCAVLLSHSTDSHKEYTVPQKNAYLQSFSLSVEELEKATGEVFFPALEKVVGKEIYKSLKKTKPESWFFK